MNNTLQMNVFRKSIRLPAYLIAILALAAGCRKTHIDQQDLRNFMQVNLVSNTAKYSPVHMDGTLMNAWGLAWAPSGIAWVNSNGGGVSEVYTGEGALIPARPLVNIPTAMDTTGGPATGIVFSGGKGFRLSNGGTANFIFDALDGILSGWNGAAHNNAILIKDMSKTSSFTGLAIGSWGTKNLIYAADFKAGKIVVWDTGFAEVSLPFQDPNIPVGFAPFNIQAVGSWLYVTYAKVGPMGHDVSGPGNGFVDIFGMDGSFKTRFASMGWLNSPWGIIAAGDTFLDANDMGDDDDHGDDHSKSNNNGKGNNHTDVDSVILIGNFGDGRINVYSMKGLWLGQLRSHNETIVINGLWALSFAPSTSTIDQTRLYFTAGPDGGKNGLFGYLKKQ
ncbi:MAG: TIGR03118 family protein [Sphingobacteriales bacterium 50-39]|nr:TIGR03118 family protein [Sphingobacteriales bacterium]OJW58543.1 MAG: TIGR03118 family protein [Sphingobacteriales bacterium 50-39]